jgi:hypothetical protein
MSRANPVGARINNRNCSKIGRESESKDESKIKVDADLTGFNSTFNFSSLPVCL